MLAPFADHLLSWLKTLFRNAGSTAVRSRTLADMLNISLRTVQWYLSKLEAAGLVAKRGKKGGWLPVTTGA